MPRMPKSRFKLPPLKHVKGSLGTRIAHIRKERGLSQTELAARIGIIQTLISDYERDRRRLHAEMVIRLAQALHVSTDELLGVKPVKTNGVERLSLKLTRRLKGIENLPPAQQRVLLKTIDQFLKGPEQP
jgi:transcriptional regulator with XRE-family HTH domain